jgi:hypothetical protein
MPSHLAVERIGAVSRQQVDARMALMYAISSAFSALSSANRSTSCA